MLVRIIEPRSKLRRGILDGDPAGERRGRGGVRGLVDRARAFPYLRISVAKSTYSISEAQSALPRLVREAQEGELVAIARRDETVAYRVSREHLEAIVETLELLANPRARKALADHKAGRTQFLPLSALDE